MTISWKKVLSALGLTTSAATLGLIYYAHNKRGQSLSSLVVNRVLWNYQIGEKQLYAIEEKPQEAVDELIHLNRESIKDPGQYLDCSIKEFHINDMQVFSLNDKKDKKQPIVFYLHGGGYVFPPTKYHFTFLNDIIKQTDVQVMVPVYLKSPEYTIKDSFPKVVDLYKEVLKEVDSSQRILFMGDSAGGGYSLGLAVYLRDHRIPQPKSVILISPWLDISNSNPDIFKLSELDPFMTPKSLDYAGLLWAGSEENLEHPYVSPYFADVHSLPLITLMTGTHETFYQTILDYSDKLSSNGVTHHLIVEDQMTHVYPLMPTIEGRRSRRLISDIIRYTK